MTPQTIVGLVLIVLGIGVKVAAAAGWLPGDITFIGEIMALGTFLLGKELAPASAAAQARRSSKPPPPPPIAKIGMLFLVLLLVGCAGTPEQAAQNRIDANALRDQVNDASDALSQAHGALPFVCAYLGPESSACTTLEDTYRVLASAVGTTHRGIDLLDAVGVGGEQLRESVGRVLAESEAFGASVARMGEEVADVLEATRSDRGPGGTVPERGAAEAAPAEDAGQAPAEAPSP